MKESALAIWQLDGAAQPRRSSASFNVATVRASLPSLSRPNWPMRKLRKSVGSYCENEAHCHRLVMGTLLIEKGAPNE